MIAISSLLFLQHLAEYAEGGRGGTGVRLQQQLRLYHPVQAAVGGSCGRIKSQQEPEIPTQQTHGKAHHFLVPPFPLEKPFRIPTIYPLQKLFLTNLSNCCLKTATSPLKINTLCTYFLQIHQKTK